MKKKNLFRCFFSCLLVLSMCMTGIHAQETTGWNDHAHSDVRVTVDAQSDQAFDSTENYALNKEVSVSGLEVPDRLLGPEAVDGSLDTRWSASPDEEEQWIIVDLSAAYPINLIKINFSECPHYQVLVSENGTDYETVADITDGGVDQVEREFSFTSRNVRYIKLLQLSRRQTQYGTYGITVWEIGAFYDPVLEYKDTNLALNKEVEVSSTEVEDRLLGPEAVDGNRDTRWSASPDSDEQWIVVDLQDNYVINEIDLLFYEVPRYEILVSKDNVEYESAALVEDGKVGLDPISRTFTFDPIECRYVKFVQYARRDTSLGVYSTSIFELEVYYKDHETIDTIEEVQEIPPVLSEDGTSIILPSIDLEGNHLELYGSSNESVIALDGSVTQPLQTMDVSLLYQLVNEQSGETETADKEAIITIPGKYETEAQDNPRPDVLPAIQEWKGLSGDLSISGDIVIEESVLRSSAEIIASYFDSMLGIDAQIREGQPADGDIYLSLCDDQALGEEGYHIDMSADHVNVSALSEKGILYAGTTLTQMLDGSEEKNTLPRGLIRDYPAYEVRSMMFDVARFYMPLDYLEEIGRYMAYFKCNELHVHINDDGGEQDSCFRIESKRYPEINQGNKDGEVYTQEEYRQFQRNLSKYGVKVITELDSPTHAGFVRYHDPSLMLDDNHIDIRNEEAVDFIKKVIDELLDEEDPVILSDTFHVGCDEYFRYDAEKFEEYRQDVAEFDQEISDYVLSKGYECRMWNMLGSSVYPGVGMVSTDVVMNYFAPYQADYAETLEAGYPIINSYADWLYIVPEVGYGNHIPLSDLYAMWEVNNLGGGFSVPKSSPMLRGAEPCFWYDLMVGCSEFDIFNAVKKEMMLVCEKAWYGEPSEQHDLDDFIQRVDQLGNYAPNANPARYIVNHTDEDILLSYDVEQTEDERLEDRSGNGYDAMMHQVEIVKDGDDHVAKFDGSSYLTLPFDSVGFPYTVTFDLLIEEQDEESIALFDGKDGTLYLNYDGTGKIGYERKGLSYLFDQEIETGRWQNITIVCDRSNAKLYIDQVYSGSGQYYQVDAERQSSSTFVLPVETVGAGFKGCLDDLVIYDEALTIVNPDNLAQNKPVTVSGVEVPDRMLGPDAVDGDPATRWSASPEGAEQWLIVDLEEQVDLGRIYLNFQEPPRYEIQVSADGENFTTVLKVDDGVTDGSTVERSYDLDGITARYVKILQLEQRFVGDYYGMGIYELEVYSDQADKTALQQLIETCSIYEADEYTSVSWETFHSALDEAIAVLEKEDAEQSEINDAAAKLTSAMDALQVKASTSAIQALRNMVDKANALGSDDEALNNAIETAQALLNDPDNASLTAVVSALLELSEAMQALNMDESIDALRADVQATIDFINENILTNVDGIRPGKVQALKDAVAAAEDLLANADASADELKAANEAMTKAAQELWEIVSKAELNALIEAANGYLDGEYTAESLEALQTAITAAQAVADNDDATTSEVTEAITNLSNAIAGLESITLDTSALEYEIELVTEMLANLDDYIASSVEGLQEKLDAAKETLENATSQAEIDEATKTLREARLNARTKADVSALEELIAYAKSLDLSAYTTESAQAVIQTLARAEQMTNDPEITQEEVNDMVKELQASVDELIEVNESANAADTTNTAAMNTVNMMFILMLAAGAAAAMAYRRKRS